MLSRQWSGPSAQSSVGRPEFITELRLWSEPQSAAAEQIASELDEVDLVRLVFCDPHGLARSKTLSTKAFRSVLRNGMDFSPGPFIFDTAHAVGVDFMSDDPGIGVGDIIGAGDFIVVPDPLTFQVLPHVEPRTAWVLGDEYLRDGSPHPLSTRAVLRRVCDRYAAQDLAPVIGLEVEWHLTRRIDGPAGNVGNGFGSQAAAPRVEAVNAGYQFNSDTYLDGVADVVGPLSTMLLALGLPLRSMEHESGPGQIEFTFGPMFAPDAADAMLLLRTVIKQACSRRGFHASFMSLPRIDGFDPSGWHLHQSVNQASTGRNVFAVDERAEGVSPEAKAYIDGMLARARDFCLLSVPTVNGYRRLGPSFPLSPTKIGWSFEDRTAMVRVLGQGAYAHIENRTGEPCANPYLLIASQLFAGLDGLCGDAGSDRASAGTGQRSGHGSVQTLPGSLREALDEFRRSDRTQDLLGRPLALCLAKLKQSEVSRFEEWCTRERPAADDVTEWEQREYFRDF